MKFVESLISDKTADVKDRRWAVELALAYSRGKPRQQLELMGEGGGPLAFSGIIVTPQQAQSADEWQKLVGAHETKDVTDPKGGK